MNAQKGDRSMFVGQETLLSLTEIAIALAGFAAIVVSVRRREKGDWTESDGDFFAGMILHSVFAAVFGLLPTLLHALTLDLTLSIEIAAPRLGIQIVCHSVAIMFSSTTPVWARIPLGVGTVLGLSQFLTFTDAPPEREFAFYTAGIIWHLFQAGMLFVLLTATRWGEGAGESRD